MGRIVTYKRIVLIMCALAGVSVSPIAHANFTQTLKEGDTHPEVKQLQQFLNIQGFTVAQTGPGSAGNETDYFGPATKNALSRYQEAYKADILTPLDLTTPTGTFGPASRAHANARLTIQSLPPEASTTSVQSLSTGVDLTTGASSTRYLTQQDFNYLIKRIETERKQSLRISDDIEYSAPIESLTGVTLGDATFEDTDASFDSLSVSGNTSLATLTVTATTTLDGRIVITSNTAPADTTDTLYNVGGDLYWAGNVIGGATTGQWTSDGTNVWRAGGSLLIGTSSVLSTSRPCDGCPDYVVSGTLSVDGDTVVKGSVYSDTFTALTPNSGYYQITLSQTSNKSAWGFWTEDGAFSGDNGSLYLDFFPLDGGTLTRSPGAVSFSPYGRLGIGVGYNIVDAALHIVSNSPTVPGLLIRGSSGQTADLLQLKNSSGFSLVNIGATGSVGIGTANPTHKLDVVGDCISLNGVCLNESAPSNIVNYVGSTLGFSTVTGLTQNLTRWLGAPGTALTSSDISGTVITRSGYLTNAYVKASASTFVGTTTITVYNNGVSTNVSLQLAPSQTSLGSTTLSIPVTGGDRISMRVVTTAGAGTLSNLAITLEQVVTTNVFSSQWINEGTDISFSTGNVGIGTSSPSHQLTIAGDIFATGAIYASDLLDTAPDYVFEPGYNRLTLDEIEASTTVNAHLPWLTPRGTGAMSIGARVNEILEALENLFLHVFDLAKRLVSVEDKNLEQDAKNEEQDAEIEALKAEIRTLKGESNQELLLEPQPVEPAEPESGAGETPQPEPAPDESATPPAIEEDQPEETPPSTAPAQDEEELGAVEDEQEPTDPEPTAPASIEAPAEAEPPTEDPQPTAPPA